MTLSYAGVNLGIDAPELIAWVERCISPADVGPFVFPTWTLGLAQRLTLTYANPFLTPLRPVRIGRLWWPTGAARWAVGYFLADQAMLEQIRQQIYPSGGGALVSEQLLISDGTFTLTPEMYMLPARPLAQVGEGGSGSGSGSGRALWLLTLVDERYFYWYRSGTVHVNEGSTTWYDLYDQIGAALEVTITPDLIPSAYLKPANVLGRSHEALPLLLDAVAAAVGQRIVRDRDGNVRAMNVTNSKAILEGQYTRGDLRQYAGGLFELEVL